VGFWSRGYSVEIVQRGRDGDIRYVEGDHSYDFYWEFGGADVVGSISVPSREQWAAALPWAAERRDEVLQRVGEEAPRKRCRGCRVAIRERSIDLLAS
jgi:hypothetical protein